MADRIPSLNVISPDVEGVFVGTATRCAVVHHASSLADLRSVLEGRLGIPPSPVTLDLIGHSTREHHLLRLGDTAIDMLDPAVARFFHWLGCDGLMRRLEVAAVRLLGCETAVSTAGRGTVRLLASTLRIPVFGTTKPVGKSHYDEHGFNPVFAHVLVEATNLV